jgi:hypothetical protein
MDGVLRWIGTPGSRPWLRAGLIGLALLILPLAWWSLLWLTPYRPPRPEASGLPVALVVAAGVIIAPLLETAALAVLRWLTVKRFRLGLPFFLAAAVVLAVLAHWPVTLVRAPITALLFLAFAWQYAGWSAASTRRWFALLAVALTHAVYNLGSIGLSPLWAVLLKGA